MDSQMLKDLVSVVVHLNEGYLEVAQKIAAIENSFMEDIAEHKQSRRTYQKYLSELDEVKQEHGKRFGRYAECEKTLTKLQKMTAEPVARKVIEKPAVAHPDPDAHLGRRGVE